jgi:serine/threonine protein kinase
MKNLKEIQPQPYSKSDYTNIKLLGQGLQGSVFSAYDKKLKKMVVIKKMSRFDEVSATEEAKILRYLSAKCQRDILCYENFKVDDDFYYLIVEHLIGFKTLEELIASHYHFSDQQLFIIIKQMKRGLQSIHKQKIAHRDIKPGNIMINLTTYQIKYIDFGVSCYRPTCHADMLGTAIYMAPELLLPMYDHTKRHLSPDDFDQWKQADYWSLGVTIMELIMGIPITKFYLEEYKKESDNLMFYAEDMQNHGIDQDVIHEICSRYSTLMCDYITKSISPLLRGQPNKRQLKL